MKPRIAVIYGGRSGEHEISLLSAESIISVLDPKRYEVLRYFIDKEGRWHPHPILPEPGAPIDVVFPIVHGTFGEDGTLQGLLELADLPYVGANVLASALSMDKDMMKRVCRDGGLPVVAYKVVTRQEIETGNAAFDFPYPMFVKPANLGSSVGISKAHNEAELKEALRIAAEFDSKVIVEQGIEGREFECSVLGNDDPEAAMPCEILPSREFYDYEDKYVLNKARIVLPPDLPKNEVFEMRRLAVECYKAVGCEGMARVDFLRETATAKWYINEINTIPGFTAISMFPKMWDYCGVRYSELIDRLIQLALDRHAARKATRFTR